MPATQFEFGSGTYAIRCLGCGTTLRSATPFSPDGLTDTGRAISETFRFVNRDNNFSTRCRNCERARRRNSTRRTATTTAAPLGINRRFGVEFECAVPREIDRYTIQAALQAEGLVDWIVKTDCSIHVSGMSGFEIVSPPLSGDEGEQAIRTAARVLTNLGATVNRTCGTHVHHDANDLTVEQIKRVARGWFNNQRLIDGLVSPSRRSDNENNSMYCQPLTDTEVTHIESKTDLRSMRSLGISRYKTLNLDSYGRRGTIEIRQHQGTLDAEKVISWMRLGQAIIDTAKVETAPLATASRMRDLLTTLGDRLNETARTFLLGRAVEFGWATV